MASQPLPDDPIVKVLMIPDWRGNPYQSELARGLAQHGVATTFESRFRWTTVGDFLRQKSTFDVLHLHWAHPFLLSKSTTTTLRRSFFFVAKLVVLKLAGVKLIWTIHNIAQHDSHGIGVEVFVNRILARMMDTVIAQSEYAKKEVMAAYRIPPSRISVVPHGNYLSVYPMDVSRTESRRRLCISNEDFVFLYFGVIRPYKGIPDLIRAFRQLDASKNSRLLIVGRPLDNEVTASVDKLTEEDEQIKTVLEFVPDEEVQMYMHAADVVVLPYRNILTSGSLKLAMSFGKPVIAPSTGSIPEFLGRSGGFLYSDNDDAGLLRCLRQAIETAPSRLDSMGRANRQVAERLDWVLIGEMTSRLYRSIP